MKEKLSFKQKQLRAIERLTAEIKMERQKLKLGKAEIDVNTLEVVTIGGTLPRPPVKLVDLPELMKKEPSKWKDQIEMWSEEQE